MDHTVPLIVRYSGLITICFVFKFFNNKLPNVFFNFFKPNSFPYSNRSALCYQIQSARTNYKKFAIKCLGPHLWNPLPSDLKLLHSFPMFKNRCKSYILCNDIARFDKMANVYY